MATMNKKTLVALALAFNAHSALAGPCASYPGVDETIDGYLSTMAGAETCSTACAEEGFCVLATHGELLQEPAKLKTVICNKPDLFECLSEKCPEFKAIAEDMAKMAGTSLSCSAAGPPGSHHVDDTKGPCASYPGVSTTIVAFLDTMAGAETCSTACSEEGFCALATHEEMLYDPFKTKTVVCSMPDLVACWSEKCPEFKATVEEIVKAFGQSLNCSVAGSHDVDEMKMPLLP